MPLGLVRTARPACQKSARTSATPLFGSLRRALRGGSPSRRATLTGVSALLLGMATLAGAQTATVLGASWTQQATATSPPVQSSSSSAYDTATGTIVLFGGATATGGNLGDTWTYNGTTWTQQSPASSPPARQGSTMTYDAATGTVVLFGGYGAGSSLNDTWTYDGTTWTQQSPAASPSVRNSSTMAYDAATGTVVLFGGIGPSGVLGDTWTYNGTTWTQQSPSLAPPARYLASMAYDAATGTVVLFGGLNANGTLGDTWTYNGTTWTQQSPASSPSARQSMTLAYDAATGTAVMFGGYAGGAYLGDTWTYNGTTWTQQFTASTPPARNAATTAYDAATGNVVLFGGYNGSSKTNDTWTYAIGTFVAPATPVGTAATQTPVYFTITSAGTLPALSNSNVLTTGSAGLDFTLGTGSTCSGAVTAGQTCMVDVSFTPGSPGLRKGAVNLLNSSGTVIASALISGTGTGPQAVFTTPVITSMIVAGAQAFDIVEDGAGDLYVGASGNSISRYPAGSSTGTVVATNNSSGALGIDGAGNVYYLHLNTLWQIPQGTGTPFQLSSNGCQNSQQVVIDGTGNVYIACTGAKDVIELAAGSYALIKTFGLGTIGAGHGLAVDPAGNMYVSDTTNSKIWKITPDNVATTVVSGITYPSDLIVDAGGSLIVANETSNLTVYAPDFSSSYTIAGVAPGRVYAINLTPTGNLIAADTTGNVNLVNRNTTPALMFPSTAVGSVSAPLTVTMANVGNLPLNITAPASGFNPAVTGPYVFGNSSTCPQVSSMGTTQTLASGATCTDVITFQPTSISTANPGTLTTSDNSNNAASTQLVTLSGASTQAPQTITFPQPPAPAYIGASATLTATASSGLAVTYSITSGPATLSGSTVTYTGTGTVVIAANQSGNTNYSAAPTVSDTVTVTAPSTYTAPTTAVGGTSANQMATVTFTTAGTASNISVLTQGATGLDFAFRSGGTCTTGTAYTVGQTCSVLYAFGPKYPYTRTGGVVVADSSGNVLANVFLTGLGTGPLAVFPPLNTSAPTQTLTSGQGNVEGVAVDGSGNVYLTPGANSVLELVAVGGVIPASPTTRSFTGYSTPVALAVDGSGNLYAAGASGKLVEYVAVGGALPATPAVRQFAYTFSGPQSVAVDVNGNVYVADTGSNQILEFQAVNGVIPTSATPISLGSGFTKVFGVAVDTAGDVFVVDQGASKVYELLAVNGAVPASPTQIAIGSGFSGPLGVSVDRLGNVYVSDQNSHSVKEIVAVNGSVSTTSVVLTLGSSFGTPVNSAVDGKGNLFVADNANSNIREFNVATAPALTFPTSTPVGSTDTTDGTKFATIENIGNTALAITSIAPSTTSFTFAGVANGSIPACSSSLAVATTCSLGATFTPQSAGALSANGTEYNNSLNTGSSQVVALSGTATQVAQTITFPQPITPAQAGTSATLTATASSGLAVTYTVTSGPASISGSNITYTGVGTVVIAANQAGNAEYSAAPTVSDTVTTTAAPTAYTAPTEPVGTASATQTAYVTITTAGTPNTISVIAQGATTLEFAFVAGGTCSTSTAYTVGQVCSIQYTFKPSTPGLRLGGAVLLNSSNASLGSSYLSGIGTGPQALYSTPTKVTYSPISAGTAGDAALDGSGNLYIVGAANTLYEVPVGGGTPAATGISANGRGVVVDGIGNVFYSTSNNALFKIPYATSGAGTQVATLTSTDNSLAIDASGNLYYVNSTGGNSAITKLAAGTYASSTIVTIPTRVIGLTFDASGNLFCAGFGNNSVYKIAAGTSTATQIITTNLNSPFGIAVDAAGDLYVANYGNGAVTRFTAGTLNASIIDFSSINTSFLKLDTAGALYYGTASGNAYRLARAYGVAAFLNTPVGSTSSAQNISFENDGNASLTFGLIQASTSNFSFAGGVANGSNPGCGGPLASAATCNVQAKFTPQSAGALSAGGVVTDNSLNAMTATQTVSLSGNGTLVGQTITFPQPTTPAQAGTSATLTATASSGLAVTYTISSGPATISGSTVTYTGAGTVVIAANQAGNAMYSAANTVSDTVTTTAAPATYTAPTEPVGTTSPTQTAYITITTAGQQAYTDVMTTGQYNLDYALVPGGTCSYNNSYAVGATCTVNYTFTPRAPGQRLGAIQIVSMSNVVLGTSLIAGTGTGAAAAFPGNTVTATLSSNYGNGLGIAVDGAGNVYVPNGSSVTEIVAVSGTIPANPTTRTLGSGFSNAYGVAVDGAGNVYVADTGNSAIKEIVAVGGSTSASSPVRTLGSGFSVPNGVTVDGAGNVYVADTNHSLVKEIVAVGGSIPTTSPTINTLGSGFSSPVAVAVDGSGNVYVANYGNGKVQEIIAVGGSTSSTSTVQNLGSGFNSTYGVAVDAAGNVYVGDQGNGLVKEILAVGGSIPASSPTILTLGNGFSRPGAVAVDGVGNVYVADSSKAKQISLATPPGLAFPTTTVGSVSSPLPVQLQNIGNVALAFPAPSSGSNPLAGPGFLLDPSTTCPVVAANGTPGSLASGATCLEIVDFRPSNPTGYSSTLQLTDNSLSSSSATQSIPLSGAGTYSQPTVTSITPAAGPSAGGTTVTLTGTNFSGVGYVYFGATAATSFTYVNNTTIRAVSPAGTSTVDITVNNPSYTSPTSAADQFNYVSGQTITFPQPATPAGTNTTATLTATASSGLPVTYTITSGPATISGSTITYTGAGTVIIAADQAGNTNYTAAPEVTRTVIVQMQTIFVTNSGGSVTSLFDNGAVQSSAVSGGGIGAAVDADGYVWSIYANGNGLSLFADNGALYNYYNGYGAAAATALAVDGSNLVYFTNGNGTIDALNKVTGNIYRTPVAAAAGISSPTAMSVDAAGSLWIASAGDNSVVEIIGAAAPVVTPTVNAVKNTSPGTRP